MHRASAEVPQGVAEEVFLPIFWLPNMGEEEQEVSTFSPIASVGPVLLLEAPPLTLDRRDLRGREPSERHG